MPPENHSQITGPPIITPAPTIRRCITIGHSYGITVPSLWVRKHIQPHNPYVQLTCNPDGSLTIRPITVSTLIV